MDLVAIKRVGVLRGGDGESYLSSLKTGGDIISHINQNLAGKYKTFDILIDKDGTWHLNGMPIRPDDLIHKIDVVWNTSHANLANTLEGLSIPHVSPSAFSSALETSSDLLREHMQKVGVEMPRSILFPVYQPDFDGPREKYPMKTARTVFEKFAGPWVVKSFTPDSSMGIHLAKTFDSLVRAIDDSVEHKKSILVEEFISGKVASVHSVPGFRGQEIYTFPLGNTFGVVTPAEKEKLDALVKELHNYLGAKHYLKSDFIINPRGRVYIYNIDLSPNLVPNSHFSEVCEMVGVKPHHIIDHIIQISL